MRSLSFIFVFAVSLGLTGFLSCLEVHGETKPNQYPVIQMATPTPVKPQTLSQPDERNSGAFSTYSQSDYMRFEPYNTFPRELDLWSLEKDRFIRSIPVISPEKTTFAYSEVLFAP